MQPHTWVAIVTLLSLIKYIGFGLNVGFARGKSGIHAPAMTGDPLLERAVRVQANTLEWLPIFFVSLWLFALYWSDLVAAALGLVWILGRLLYARGYLADPDKRSTGFLIQASVCLVLILGGLGRIIYVTLVTGGA
jgi:uncharacterized membrane protein YecN with MAPEG domain